MVATYLLTHVQHLSLLIYYRDRFYCYHDMFKWLTSRGPRAARQRHGAWHRNNTVKWTFSFLSSLFNDVVSNEAIWRLMIEWLMNVCRCCPIQMSARCTKCTFLRHLHAEVPRWISVGLLPPEEPSDQVTALWWFLVMFHPPPLLNDCYCRTSQSCSLDW
jgi:hypothetical protein